MGEDTMHGRVLTDRAGGPADLSRCASQPEALIPRADGWAVVRRRSPYGAYYQHDRAQIQEVRPKTISAKVGPGRRLRTRISLDDVIVVADEDAAKRLCAQLESAMSEAVRRERAARSWYGSTIGKLYASAMSAGTAETAQQAQGQSPASAVPQGIAQSQDASA